MHDRRCTDLAEALEAAQRAFDEHREELYRNATGASFLGDKRPDAPQSPARTMTHPGRLAELQRKLDEAETALRDCEASD